MMDILAPVKSPSCRQRLEAEQTLLVKQRVSEKLSSFEESLNDKNTNRYHVVEKNEIFGWHDMLNFQVNMGYRPKMGAHVKVYLS
jgi:hypothetical protein